MRAATPDELERALAPRAARATILVV
jgi:hypothetical protein